MRRLKSNVTTNIISKSEIQKKFSHLRGIELEIPSTTDVSILIGADMPELLFHLDFRRGELSEPSAVKTKLGWVLFGGKSQTDYVKSNNIS